MKKFFIIAIVVVVGWYGNYHYKHKQRQQEQAFAATNRGETPLVESNADTFQCDGRIYCSQMTSCAEATFFIRNCPGTKMDGNKDGVPCESQWCK